MVARPGADLHTTPSAAAREGAPRPRPEPRPRSDHTGMTPSPRPRRGTTSRAVSTFTTSPCWSRVLLRGREAVQAQLGLIPARAKDSAIGGRLLNARAETVMKKPAFRDA